MPSIDAERLTEAGAALGRLSPETVSQGAVTICLAFAKKKNEVTFEQLPISQEIAAEFSSYVTRQVEALDRLRKSHDIEIKPIAVGATPEDYQLEVLALDPNHPIAVTLAPLGDVADCEIASVRPERLINLRFYVVVVQMGQGQHALFVRTYSSKMEIQNSPKLAVMLQGGLFSKIREPLLLFDKKFDCLVFDGFAFVLQRTNFQRIFDYVEATTVATNVALKNVKSYVGIKNLAEFEAAVASSPRMASKLRQAMSRDLTSTVPFAKFEAIINERSLPVNVVTLNGQKMLEYDPAHKWEFLRLLDDDYLRSDLTDAQYEASGKRRMDGKKSP